MLWAVSVVRTGGGHGLVPVEGVASGGVAGAGARAASALMVIVAVGRRSFAVFGVVAII